MTYRKAVNKKYRERKKQKKEDGTYVKGEGGRGKERPRKCDGLIKVLVSIVCDKCLVLFELSFMRC